MVKKNSRLDAALVGLKVQDRQKTLGKYTTEFNSPRTSHRLTSSLMSASYNLLNSQGSYIGYISVLLGECQRDLSNAMKVIKIS